MVVRVKCPNCDRMAGCLERRVDGKKQQFQRKDGTRIHTCPWKDCPTEDFLVQSSKEKRIHNPRTGRSYPVKEHTAKGKRAEHIKSLWKQPPTDEEVERRG